jgi:hypothetical protein
MEKILLILALIFVGGGVSYLLSGMYRQCCLFIVVYILVFVSSSVRLQVLACVLGVVSSERWAVLRTN